MGGGIKDQNVSIDCGLDNLKRALFRSGEKNGFFWLDDFLVPSGDNTWYGATKPWALGGTGGTALGLAGHGGLVQLATNSNNVSVSGRQIVDFDKKPKFLFYFRTSTTLADAVHEWGLYKGANEFCVLQADAATHANFRLLHAAGGATTTVTSQVPIVAATWYGLVLAVGTPYGSGAGKRFPVEAKIYGATSPNPTVIGGGVITDADTHLLRCYLSSAAAVRNLDLDLIAVGATR